VYASACARVCICVCVSVLICARVYALSSSYQWWSEILHGVMFLNTTSFPQSTTAAPTSGPICLSVYLSVCLSVCVAVHELFPMRV
jgi:hypothetical protein